MNKAKTAAAIGIVAITIAGVPQAGALESESAAGAPGAKQGARIEQRLEVLAGIIDGSLGGLEIKLTRLASGGDIVG